MDGTDLVRVWACIIYTSKIVTLVAFTTIFSGSGTKTVIIGNVHEFAYALVVLYMALLCLRMDAIIFIVNLYAFFSVFSSISSSFMNIYTDYLMN